MNQVKEFQQRINARIEEIVTEMVSQKSEEIRTLLAEQLYKQIILLHGSYQYEAQNKVRNLNTQV